MKTKQTLILTTSRAAWLIFLACTALTITHCAKGEDPNTGPSPKDNMTKKDPNMKDPVMQAADRNAVMQAMGRLTITYSDTDNAMSVTENITLPLTGTGDDGEDNGVAIAWESDNDGVINVETTPGTGTVTRPDMNTEVTLTATLTKGEATETKDFPLTVIISVLGADTIVVTAAKTALAVTYTSGDGPMRVTGDVTLPTTGADGVMISWASSPTGVISTAGVVTRPDDMNTNVVLTATLTKGMATDTTTFPLTVIISDAGAVKQVKENLVIGYGTGDSATRVTKNVTLPLMETGDDGGRVDISWVSSPTGVISTAGVVTRPGDMDTNVLLIATLTKGDAMGMKDFNLTVIISDMGAVTQAKENLVITYASGDSASGATQNITLPLTGTGNDGENNGVTVKWASGNTNRISKSGVVSRPSSTAATVNLTATLTKGGGNRYKNILRKSSPHNCDRWGYC